MISDIKSVVKNIYQILDKISLKKNILIHTFIHIQFSFKVLLTVTNARQKAIFWLESQCMQYIIIITELYLLTIKDFASIGNYSYLLVCDDGFCYAVATMNGTVNNCIYIMALKWLQNASTLITDGLKTCRSTQMTWLSSGDN